MNQRERNELDRHITGNYGEDYFREESAPIGWVYIMSEPGLLTVGFYDPSGKWHSDSDHNSREEAAKRVNFLNGGHSAHEGKSETPPFTDRERQVLSR